MDLGLCVGEVQLVDEFALTGRRVVLIGIPGFDDTTKYADVLMITDFSVTA